MLRLILSRLLQLPVILVITFLVTFALAWIVPGNPLENPDGRRPPPEVVEAMMRQYNLDSPIAFLKGYLHGVFIGSPQNPAPDFGPSLVYPHERVSGILASGLKVSVPLGLAALGVGLVLGSTAGVIGALKPKSMIDTASLAIALIGVSLPSFVTGSILLVVFAGMLRWLPVGGWGRPDQFILPALTLGVFPAAYIARLIRLGLADIMSSDFIRTARAKGLSRSMALFKHAIKVALLPVVSFLGPAAASVMTGSFVVEKIFQLPGIGEHFVNAVVAKDQFLILGIVLLYSTMLVVFNLVVDVAYAWFDPRIELA